MSEHELKAREQGDAYQDTFSIEETTSEEYERHKLREDEMDKQYERDRLYRTFFIK